MKKSFGDINSAKSIIVAFTAVATIAVVITALVAFIVGVIFGVNGEVLICVPTVIGSIVFGVVGIVFIRLLYLLFICGLGMCEDVREINNKSTQSDEFLDEMPIGSVAKNCYVVRLQSDDSRYFVGIRDKKGATCANFDGARKFKSEADAKEYCDKYKIANCTIEQADMPNINQKWFVCDKENGTYFAGWDTVDGNMILSWTKDVALAKSFESTALAQNYLDAHQIDLSQNNASFVLL